MVRSAESVPESEAKVPIDLRVVISQAVFQQARLAAKDRANCRVAALLTACVLVAMAELANPSNSESVPLSVSLIVDMRPYVLAPQSVSQAIGSVTLGAVVEPSSRGFSGNADERSRTLFDYVLQVAGQVSVDFQTRMARGEAHRQAACMASGQFQHGAPEGTIEISNHGIYDTGVNGRERAVLCSQRFDGYEGLSLAAYSESGSGEFHLALSRGRALDERWCTGLLERIAQLLELVAAQHGEMRS